MKRKIVLPTDFSDNALHAVQFALELYRDQKCLFYLLNAFHVKPKNIESLIGMEPGNALYETTKKNSETELHRLLSTVAFGEHGNPNHSFQVVSVFNEPWRAIKNLIKEKDVELIVMGTRGQTNSKHRMYGSTAMEVMDNIRNCPVIVVPQSAKQGLPKEIVFPTDFKTALKKRRLSYLIEIANISQASIKVLHISEDGNLDEEQNNTKNMLEDYLETVSHSFHFMGNSLSVPASINCFVESRESDMIAFISRKHSFIASILNPPLSKGIAYSSRVPFLVMHE